MYQNHQKLSLGKRFAAGAMTTFLGVSMSIPFGTTRALAEEAKGSNDSEPEGREQEGISQTAKTEAVYTKTDASGESTGIYVVNSFNTDDAEDVEDPGTYTTVENLSTSQQLTNEDGKTDVTTSAGQPFYYQGDLDAGTQLPWTVNLTYTLDGQSVSPDDLAGKSGDLDIELDVTGLSDDSSNADFAKSFVLQAQGTFPNDGFDLVDSGDATVTQVGDDTLVTYLLLPGEDGTYHIRGKATDFTYSGWQISAMPLTMAINLSDYDTSELTDKVQELEDGAQQLDDGGNELADGLLQLSDGAASAKAGSAQLSSGASQLASGLGQLKGGTSQVASGASALRAGLSQLKTEGTSQVANGARTLSDGMGQLKDGTSQVASGASQLADGTKTLQTKVTAGADQLRAFLYSKDTQSSLYALDSGANKVSNGVRTLYESLSTTLPSTLDSASKQVTALQGQLDGIKQSLGSLDASSMVALGTKTQQEGSELASAVSSFSQQLKGTSAQLSQAADSAAQLQQAMNGAGQYAGAASAQAESASGDAQAAADSASAASSALSNVTVSVDGLTDEQQAEVNTAVQNAIASAKTSADAAASSAQKAAGEAAAAKGAADGAQSAASQAAGGAGNLSQALSDGASQADPSNFSDLTAKADSFSSDLTTLSSGVGDLTSSAQAILDTAQKMLDDSNTLVDGTSQQLSSMNGQLNQLKQLRDGAAELAGGVDKLSASLSSDGEIAQQIDELTDGVNQLYAGASQLSTGASALDKSTDTAVSGAKTLASGASQLDQSTGTALSGANTLADGASTLDSSTDSAVSGAQQVASSASQLDDGIGTLSSGTDSAYAGSLELKAGLDELAESVQGMDQKVLDELQEKIDEKLGRGYQLHSFVDPDNTNVKEVEFIYVVSGVTEPDDDSNDQATETEGQADDQSFIDRLAALFQ